MPLQATSGAASYDAFGGGVPVVPQYIEDVFSTYLYTGTGASQTITNGIDLSTKGGLVWIKSRGAATNHNLFDTTRGATKSLHTNSVNNAVTDADSLTAFNTTGFTLGSGNTSGNQVNTSADTFVSWSLRKQPKFFDVVTWTGDDASGRAITHNLGSVPGFIVVKNIDSSDNKPWPSYHRSLGATKGIYMAYTNASEVFSGVWNNTEPTSTQFTVGYYNNSAGVNYVAYVFAHNAGGFGLTGTDNVISCGSVSATGSTLAEVNLGWEPQWLLIKGSNITNGWSIIDNMRGFTADSGVSWLQPNTSAAEVTSPTTPSVYLTSTGFKVNSNESPLNGTGTYIYIAIRRGPMKVPTSGTSVFQPIIDTGDLVETSTATFPLDMQFNTFYNQSNATFNNQINDRLRGIAFTPTFTATPHLTTASTAAETTTSTYLAFKGNGMDVSKDNGWGTGYSAVFYNFRRAPGFFDEVCYTGNSVAGRTLTHNLGVVPQLIILKARTIDVGWAVYAEPAGNTKYSELNDVTRFTTGINCWNDTSPTASVFSLSSNARVNRTGDTYVAYLFATCAGVSKVGSYTGTGSLQTINCGFTSGARFVLIKNQNVNGDWYVWDSARGISSSNDPYLLLNSTAAEVTNTNYVDTDSTGFKVTGNTAINTSSDTYIFLAIA